MSLYFDELAASGLNVIRTFPGLYVETYTAYLNNPKDIQGMVKAEIEAFLPQGYYEVMWLNTKTEAKEISKMDKHPDGKVRLVSPGYLYDIALKINSLR